MNKDFRKECLICHEHGNGFMPPAPEDCTKCHGNPPLNPGDLFTKIMEGASG